MGLCSPVKDAVVNIVRQFGNVLIDRAEDFIGDVDETTGYNITLNIDADCLPTIEVTKTVRPKSTVYAFAALKNNTEVRGEKL